VRRAQRREAQFVEAMSAQVEARNRQLITDLVEQGEHFMETDEFVLAAQRFDRALFIAGDLDADTSRIRHLQNLAQQQQEERERRVHLSSLLDSAATRYRAGDYISARYLANLVLAESPSSSEAKNWQTRADSALAEMASAGEILQERLAEVDSLLSYGKVDDALSIAKSVAEFAPDDHRVSSALRRARFEYWRSAATRAYESGSLRSAHSALDSALVLFPGHQWCTSFRTRIATELVPSHPETAAAGPGVDREPLSSELLKQVERDYKDGQNSFSAGDLSDAVAHWEMVERLAPDYQSVRAYLVKAYRLAGVELYGQNSLRDAVAVWKKAAVLDPENAEIRSYIERTETELTHLKELSYEQQ
jgi:tetratricopeptide (TPR) repeat protein